VMSKRPRAGGRRFGRFNMATLFIILGIVSILLTFILIKNFMPSDSSPKVEAVKTEPIVIAVHRLLPGELITRDSVKTVDWPEEYYPKGNVYKDIRALLGRAVKTDIYTGQPVFRFSLAGESAAPGLPVVIPPGYRAMTILVTENKGVGGFIKPGDHVDVIGTFEYKFPAVGKKAMEKQSGDSAPDSIHVAKTILQDVKVLAIAQDMYENGTNKTGTVNSLPSVVMGSESNTKGKVVSSVTLAVTPEQAEKLAYGDSRGELRLALRSNDDHENIQSSGIVSEDLIPTSDLVEKALKVEANLSPPPQEATPMPAPLPAHNIEIWEGTSKTNTDF
jgi:pilus assembly protein CpaB